MSFTFKETDLERLFELSTFPKPATGQAVLFGLRGARPVADSAPFAASQLIQPFGVDYQFMRCTLGVWAPGEGLTVYAGSTVPNGVSVQKSLTPGGGLTPDGLNQMMTGRHRDYGKGAHDGATTAPHRALRQTRPRPVLRTREDLLFEVGDDFAGVALVNDNIHCAFNDNVSVARFSSLGCSVVCGRPATGSDLSTEAGPWKAFMTLIYGREQRFFDYALFEGTEAQRISELGPEGRPFTVRFGSNGDLVKHLQTELINQGHNLGPAGADGDFGPATLTAVIAVQRRSGGFIDGVVGRNTAAALNLPWPTFGGPGFTPAALLGTPQPAPAAAPRALTPAPEVIGERTHWTFMDPVAGVKRTAGHESRFSLKHPATGATVTTRGLERLFRYPPGDVGPRYAAADWRSVFGLFADFIEPTAEGESFRHFSCINSYDRAAMTFGFFQFAAHTPDRNLVLLFRALLALPEATEWFPDLTLGPDGRVHRKGQGGVPDQPLEGRAPRADGLGRPEDQGRFMDYLNPDLTTVTATEATAAARMVAWACNSVEHRRAQVNQAVGHAKLLLKETHGRLKALGGAGLEGVPLPLCAMVMDIRHQGRARTSTSRIFADLKAALADARPLDELEQFGITAHRDRIGRVRDRVEALAAGPNGGLRYRSAGNDFG